MGGWYPSAPPACRHHQVLVLVVDVLACVPRVLDGAIEPSHGAVGIAADVRLSQSGGVKDWSACWKSVFSVVHWYVSAKPLIASRRALFALCAATSLGSSRRTWSISARVALVPRELRRELDGTHPGGRRTRRDVAVALARALALVGGACVLHDARAVEGAMRSPPASTWVMPGNIVHGGGRRATLCVRFEDGAPPKVSKFFWQSGALLQKRPPASP